MTSEFIVMGVVWYIVFLLSTTCHEAGHAFVARLGGDPTASHGGQASLDPLPHIRREPFGMVIFPIISYAVGGWMMGWASAPYDPMWAERYPRRAAWMSLAGPGANFTLVLIAALCMHIGIWMGVLTHPDSINFTTMVQAVKPGFATGIATCLSLLFSLNLLLGTFNLLPVPPLDGFSVVGIFLPEEGARKWQHLGYSIRQYSFMGLLIAWKIFDPMFQPIFSMALKALYPTQSYGG